MPASSLKMITGLVVALLVGAAHGFAPHQKLGEAGKVDYAMPVFNAKEKLRKGLIQESDIPYMQRSGGRPDGSDMKGGGRGKFDPWKQKSNVKQRYLSDELKSVSRKNDEWNNRGSGERKAEKKSNFFHRFKR